MLLRQNVILPSGDVKLGSRDYTVAMNNSPDLVQAINNFPVQGGRWEDGIHARCRARA